MLLHIYQIFSSLQGHLHFSKHFVFTFMVNFFFDHPIFCMNENRKGKKCRLDTRNVIKSEREKNLKGTVQKIVRREITVEG